MNPSVIRMAFFGASLMFSILVSIHLGALVNTLVSDPNAQQDGLSNSFFLTISLVTTMAIMTYFIARSADSRRLKRLTYIFSLLSIVLYILLQ